LKTLNIESSMMHHYGLLILIDTIFFFLENLLKMAWTGILYFWFLW